MSHRRLLLAALLPIFMGGLPGCLLKVALDAPSKPLERLARDADRMADSAEDTSHAIQTVSHEVRSKVGPNLGTIYDQAAQTADRDRNPVIVIPGILGSRLVDQKSERVVWGEFGGDGVNPDTKLGAEEFALPMQLGVALSQLTDSVRPDGALSSLKVSLLGLPIQIGAYFEILQALGVGGYRDPHGKSTEINYGEGHFTCFQFGYDWRRDNAENARRLHEFILEKKAYVEGERIKRYGTTGPVRFDLVAHSMGGLLGRYYLMYGPAELPADGTPPVLTWAGAQHVERLIQVGPPNAGSAKALEELVNGVTFSRVLPKYEASLWGTMPAAYQLLPRTRHRRVLDEASQESVDVFDPAVWEKHQWGLLDPEQDEVLKKLLPRELHPSRRRQIAADHLRKCLRQAENFQAAIDLAAAPPKNTTIHLIAGDAYPTLDELRVTKHGGVISTGTAPGDGTVTRSSALMDERLANSTDWAPRLTSPVRFQSVTFLLSDHRSLTSDPAFIDNVLFLLLEAPR
ncbi:MAG: hypothetical protein U0872_03265 [Planctomycetaceae bacterium]